MNTRFATHCRYLLGGVVIFLWAATSFADVQGDRKAIAQRIATAITNQQSKKLYVSDFLDSASGRIDKGCFFSSEFSTLIAERKQGFEVINRIDGQKLLTKSEFITTELQEPESAAKVAAATGADVLLMGKLTREGKSMNLELSLVEASTGKGFFYFQYKEKATDSFESLFPAAVDSTGTIFYFAGLDGVGDPKCIHCPQPEYSDLARREKIVGKVMLSVLITVDGKTDQLRMMHGLDPLLDQVSLNTIRKWRLSPSRDAAGNDVPIRTCIEVTFHMY